MRCTEGGVRRKDDKIRRLTRFLFMPDSKISKSSEEESDTVSREHLDNDIEPPQHHVSRITSAHESYFEFRRDFLLPNSLTARRAVAMG